MILQIFREEFTYSKRKRRTNPPFNLCLIHQTSLLSSISITPRVGSHHLLNLLHTSDCIQMVLLIEPLFDSRSVEVQSIALSDIRDIPIPHRSVHRGF